MPVSKLAAWTMYKAASLRQEEGTNAIEALMGDDVTEYQAHAADLDFEMSQIVVEAQNEGALLLNDHPVPKRLEFTPAHSYTAADYRDLVTIFEGSEYEKLHLSAFFRIHNVELLFDLVKPAS